jgi:hypothetical protein
MGGEGVEECSKDDTKITDRNKVMHKVVEEPVPHHHKGPIGKRRIGE